MTLQLAIGTFAGAFIFPFMIRLMWGKFVDNFGPIGGWMAAGFIVGTAWTLTHGVGAIYQTGGAWVDQAFAAFSGLWIASAIAGDDVGKSIPTIICSIVGGIIAGYVLFSFLG
ncbi:hypothetical protein HYG86_07455 [Alkalicella caledoniensis]|uniref:Uncharacterized protein n=1 Tax=Alkalicella caledoniensis TaxID=2731377 RepID=A0A7G9W7G9_ALKCA|nr:hypothetical protein [Alkalicella caledoniensis]QNO14631.1 hypothetical protein HYG86_07455 [Alkalicella caledoniensis]